MSSAAHVSFGSEGPVAAHASQAVTCSLTWAVMPGQYTYSLANFKQSSIPECVLHVSSWESSPHSLRDNTAITLPPQNSFHETISSLNEKYGLTSWVTSLLDSGHPSCTVRTSACKVGSVAVSLITSSKQSSGRISRWTMLVSSTNKRHSAKSASSLLFLHIHGLTDRRSRQCISEMHLGSTAISDWVIIIL